MDVLRELLGDHAATSTVLEVVAKLVERNHELELLLARAGSSKHHNERIAKEQLDLFLEKLRAASQAAVATANEKLETTAAENGGRADPPKPPKQPPVRKPAPPEIPRI